MRPVNPLATLREHDEGMRANGYYLAREHFPFGYCPWYRSDDDRLGFYLWPIYPDRGLWKVVDWISLKEILADQWRPLTWEDQAWFRHNVSSK